jgi:GntR family transcriptional regulator
VIARSPSLTEQVMSHLRARILEGEFADGRIPAETELAADLGVSRTTVRDALSRLEHERVIVRKQGAGTFVNAAGLQITSRLEDMWSYEDVLRDHGFTPSVDVLRMDVESADEDTSTSLALQPGAEVIVIEKLFREDAQPVALTINRIPASFVGLVEKADAGAPIYRFLADHCGRHLAYYLSDIVPVALDPAAAGALGVVEGTAAISFEEIGFDQDDHPVLSARSYFRDDLLRFRLIRRKTV